MQRRHIVRRYTREIEDLLRRLVLKAGRGETMLGRSRRPVTEQDVGLARK